jgi:hypothetical protein
MLANAANIPLLQNLFASISNDVDETELDKKPPAKKPKDAKGNSISDGSVHHSSFMVLTLVTSNTTSN